MGHHVANDYTYKRRLYVLERLYYEESIGYRGRVMFLRELQEKRAKAGLQRPSWFDSLVIVTDDDLYLNEYPLALHVSSSDKDIKGDRLNPKELMQQDKVLCERMERINQEFIEKELKKETN